MLISIHLQEGVCMFAFKTFALIAIFNISSAFAFPEAPVNDLGFRPSQFSKSIDTQDYGFEGIVKLSNCSGSLIQFEGQSDSSKAVVLTNGHCVPKGYFGGMLKPGEVIVNKNVNRSMKIFKDKDTLLSISATKVIYATMTKTDLALYELSETYQQIKSRTDISPFILASQRPTEKTPIEIVSGYWERGYSCAIDAFVDTLKEAEWVFKDSIRYTSGCDTVGGTSGSPIIETGTREVIAINNTANESGQKCTLNNPCEVNETGTISSVKGLRYGQQTYQIYSCLTNDQKLDLNLTGCDLQK